MKLSNSDYQQIFEENIGTEVFRIYEGVLDKLKPCYYLDVIEEFLAAFKYLYEEKRIRIFSSIEFGDEKAKRNDRFYAVAYWEEDPELIISIIRKWMLEQNVDWNEAYSYQFFFGFPGVAWFKGNGEVFDMFEGMDL